MAQPEAALAAALAKINKTATPQDLKTSGPRLRALLADVLQEIDGSVSGDVDDQIALLRVLGLDPTPDLRDQLLAGDRRAALPLLEFCTANRLRGGLGGRAGRGGPAGAAEAARGRAAQRALEVGVPETWDLDKLAALAKIDGKETAAHPRRTMSQRWKASARRLAAKMPKRTGGTRRPAAATMFERFGVEKSSPSCVVGKKPATDKEAPPKDCLHATEPGAVTPQLLWSYPRREPGELAGEVLPFCFPNGVRVERSKPDGDDDAFVFQLSLPDDGPAAAAASGQSQSLVYGVCVVEWASRATASGSFAVPRATCPTRTRRRAAVAPLEGADARTPRSDAAGHAARVVCRHVAKLATVALKFESTQAANPAAEPPRRAGDQRVALWARRSTNLRLDESIARDPMRRVFFERVAESQARAVYRESFPTFAGFGVGADRQRRASAASISPQRQVAHTAAPAADDDASAFQLDDPSVITELGFEGQLEGQR
ncbi:hypothetical protein JL720_14252 [Aureococcus anophagefferens]|nr:hypothetical protein JL720_14252 [Aureococcus anophagefferens]